MPIYREEELEPAPCPQCGSDNVLTAPEWCETCAAWRKVMEEHKAADFGRQIIVHATMIGDLIEERHPQRETDQGRGIPIEDVEEVADVITLVVAQILQSWLDAGSEREVTLEELGPHILEHVQGWAV